MRIHSSGRSLPRISATVLTLVLQRSRHRKTNHHRPCSSNAVIGFHLPSRSRLPATGRGARPIATSWRSTHCSSAIVRIIARPPAFLVPARQRRVWQGLAAFSENLKTIRSQNLPAQLICVFPFWNTSEIRTITHSSAWCRWRPAQRGIASCRDIEAPSCRADIRCHPADNARFQPDILNAAPAKLCRRPLSRTLIRRRSSRARRRCR